MKHAICVHDSATSINSRIYQTFVDSTIYQTVDSSLESAKKILVKMYGKKYVKKLKYISKRSVFDYYTFRDNHLDWEYSTITVEFIDIKKID